jgi:hypothetical protein
MRAVTPSSAPHPPLIAPNESTAQRLSLQSVAGGFGRPEQYSMSMQWASTRKRRVVCVSPDQDPHISLAKYYVTEPYWEGAQVCPVFEADSNPESKLMRLLCKFGDVQTSSDASQCRKARRQTLGLAPTIVENTLAK